MCAGYSRARKQGVNKKYSTCAADVQQSPQSISTTERCVRLTHTGDTQQQWLANNHTCCWDGMNGATCHQPSVTPQMAKTFLAHTTRAAKEGGSFQRHNKWLSTAAFSLHDGKPIHTSCVTKYLQGQPRLETYRRGVAAWGAVQRPPPQKQPPEIDLLRSTH